MKGSYQAGRWIGRVVERIGPKTVGATALIGALALVAGKIQSIEREHEVRTSKQRAEEAATVAAAAAASAAAIRSCVEQLPGLLTKARAALKAADPAGAEALVSSCVDHADGPEVQALQSEIKKVRDVLQAKADATQRLLDKKAAAELKAMKKRHGIKLGMTMQDVLDSNWGRPDSVNRTIGSYGTHEQWVYGSSYIYFENGILTTIQN